MITDLGNGWQDLSSEGPGLITHLVKDRFTVTLAVGAQQFKVHEEGKKKTKPFYTEKGARAYVERTLSNEGRTWHDDYECECVRFNFGVIRLTGRPLYDGKRRENVMDRHIAEYLEDYRIVSHAIHGDPSYYSVIMEART